MTAHLDLSEHVLAWLAGTMADPMSETRTTGRRLVPRSSNPGAEVPAPVSEGLSTVRAMVVFSNQRLGPAAELLVSPEVATAMLASTAEAARPLAQGRWEHELVVWLEDRSRRMPLDLDVGDLAWSPENFERQRRFLTEAIERAALGSPHSRALALWARMIGLHLREHVLVGRRWQWTSETATV